MMTHCYCITMFTATRVETTGISKVVIDDGADPSHPRHHPGRAPDRIRSLCRPSQGATAPHYARIRSEKA